MELKWWHYVIGVVLCAALGSLYMGQAHTNMLQELCISTGGTPSTASCCGLSGGDYPNNCAIGACGCAPQFSHATKVCGCGTGKCFTQNLGCVPSTVPSSQFQVQCQAAGGHWNECGSTCAIDNQGKGVACPAMCGQLCECGGIAGWQCPTGYTCKTPANILDALGYCLED